MKLKPLTITQEPSLTGNNGKAWDVNMSAVKGAALKQWLIYLPLFHPFWDMYSLGVCSLRDIPGIPPAIKQYSEAEYELLMVALSPDHDPDPTNFQTLVPLEPVNYVNQFHGLTDDEAMHVGLTMVSGLVHGIVVPEPQGIIGARELWNKTVEKAITVCHLVRPVKRNQ